ncbi:virulence protein RhuM/Fic/DOC family protein [Fibrobacter sp.]|uniref:virulence protein RhuM/Fic/DOC family protein n=1 Tax=Fibrobacter sp. TaxID=35828 RepID=UPI0025BE8F9A|nr:virulence protein RhuM/Fic/DOC family protein [Fibrobacter sp.]
MKSITSNKISENDQIIIYQTNDGKTQIDVRMENETVWLNAEQMALLFERDSKTIRKHIDNAIREELAGDVVVAKFATTTQHGAIKGKTQTKEVNYYNLDVIISVGYRVKSKRGVLFRQWANKVLKDYLVKGFAINNKVASLKYDELCKLVKLVGRTANTQKKFGGSTLFGHEKDQSFKSSIGQIYQTFDGIDLYPSVEEKAATLLYLVIKNHSFSDGNKRIAATLFLWFMENNRILYNKDNG